MILAGTWTAVQGARLHGWQPAVLGPARTWERSWSDLGAVDLARVFLLLAPVAVPAGIALAGLAWAWRIYAISTGLGVPATRVSTAAELDQALRRAYAESGPHLIEAIVPGVTPG